MKRCVVVVRLHCSMALVVAYTLKIMGVDFRDKLQGCDIKNVKGALNRSNHDVITVLASGCLSRRLWLMLGQPD